MIDIRPLTELSTEDLHRIIVGYVSPARYRVLKTETDELTNFTLELVQLTTPYVKHDYPLDAETIHQYQGYVHNGFSLGAYDDDELVGLAISEVQAWSNRLWVYEFHIAPAYQGKGIGTRLMNELIQRARQAKLRAIFCETQTTNVPAIGFYRKMDFTLDGINLNFYSNHDYPDDEICLFMMRKLHS
jgi:ribosomal protein S18 acetylase RimI-like enzyme